MAEGNSILSKWMMQKVEYTYCLVAVYKCQRVQLRWCRSSSLELFIGFVLKLFNYNESPFTCIAFIKIKANVQKLLNFGAHHSTKSRKTLMFRYWRNEEIMAVRGRINKGFCRCPLTQMVPLVSPNEQDSNGLLNSIPPVIFWWPRRKISSFGFITVLLGHCYFVKVSLT